MQTFTLIIAPNFLKFQIKIFINKKNNKWNCNFLLGPKYAFLTKKNIQKNLFQI